MSRINVYWMFQQEGIEPGIEIVLIPRKVGK